MGFEFTSHTIEVEISGKPYTVDLGNAATLDQIAQWSARIRRTGEAEPNEGQLRALADDVRNYLAALLGESQLEEVFAERTFNLLDGLELFAYLYAEISRSRVDSSFKSALEKYLPDIDWRHERA